MNKETYAENNYNQISVKAAYSTLLKWIDRYIADDNQYLAYGNEIMELNDAGVCFTYKVRQAISNLKIVQEAFTNPVVITPPAQEQTDVIEVEPKEEAQIVSTSNVEENVIKGVRTRKTSPQRSNTNSSHNQ